MGYVRHLSVCAHLDPRATGLQLTHMCRLRTTLRIFCLSLFAWYGCGSSSVPATSLTLFLGPTAGTLPMPFDVGIHAANATDFGAPFLGTIAITSGVGTVSRLDGEGPVAVISSTRGFSPGELIYEAIGVDNNAIRVYFFYCEPGSTLSTVYYEDTTTPQLFQLTPHGECVATNGTALEQVSFPPVTLVPPKPVPGIAIDGPDLSYNGTSPGRALWDGRSLDLYPFLLVNCTTCAQPGWWELHSLLWDPNDAEATVIIFYLFLDRPFEVSADYAFSLPRLGYRTDGGLFNATWSIQPSANATSASALPGYDRIAHILQAGPRERVQ